MNGGFKSSASRAAFSLCVEQVRNYDYHHYLCLLELPLETRKAAFAIRAFNVETARAMDVASDPKIGLTRLLWWRDALDKIYTRNARIPEHPTARALSEAVLEAKISKSWLRRSVEARIDDASRDEAEIPEKIEDLEKYAEDTASTILYATLQANGVKSIEADHAASHIGKASGVLLLIRSLPYHANRGRCHAYVPREVAKKHGVLEDLRFEDEESREGLRSAVFEMALVAEAHLEKARGLAQTVPMEARAVLLPGVAAQAMLDGLRRVSFDVFDPRLSRGVFGSAPMWFQLKLKWHSWRGKY